MNYIKYLLIIVIFLQAFVKCKTESKKLPSHQKIIKKNNTKEKNITEVNSNKKNKLLEGIWVSSDYIRNLDKNRSLGDSFNKLKTYSIIIYDRKNTIHCSYPHFKKEHQLKLENDLSVNDTNKMFFKILTFDKKYMKIKNNKGEIFQYEKIQEDVDYENIPNQIVNVESTLKKKWFANKYHLSLGNKYYEIEIDTLGYVKGKSPYIEANIFAWYETQNNRVYDIVNLKTTNENLYYVIDMSTPFKLFIREIQQPGNFGESLVRKKIHGSIEEKYSYSNQLPEAISLDSLTTKNHKPYNQNEFDLFIQKKLILNELGCYDLDSLQKIYQKLIPKSNVLSIRDLRIGSEGDNNYEEEQKIFENKTFYITGIVNNLSNRDIVIPKNNVFLVTVSSKNEVFEQLIHLNLFKNEFIEKDDALLYADGENLIFYNGILSHTLNIINSKRIFTPLFYEGLNENEKYLYFFKFETEQGNVFYSDIDQITCHKNYNSSDLSFLKEDLYDSDYNTSEIREFVIEKNNTKQKLELFTFERKEFFKLTITTSSCKKEYFGEARAIFFQSGRFYVQNTSPIYQIYFNVDYTQAKIELHKQQQEISDCLPIETIMELKK